MQSILRSATRSPMFWLLGVIGLAAIATNLAAGDGAARTEAQPDANPRELSKLIREGARIESKIMLIRSVGENLILETEDGTQGFEALENLALERILQAIRADAGDKRWLITGQVTEYRSHNYILLERVARAPRTAP